MISLRPILLLILPAILLNGCGKEERVAEVDGHVILADEFRSRYSGYLSATQSRDNTLLRQKILNNMINEILIRDDLKRLGLDRDDSAKKKLHEIRMQALLNVYAGRLGHDSLRVTEQDLYSEFRMSNSRASARYLYAKSEEEARRLKRRLENGDTFERLARDIFEDPGLANNGGYLGSFGRGEMEPALEEAAFTLPIGTISDPVRLRIGYAVVRVESRVVQPLASEYDYAKNKEELHRSVHERKSMQLVRDAVDRIGRELSPSFNDEAVALLFQHWETISSRTVDGNVVEQGREVHRERSSDRLVEFDGRSWTIGMFLDRLEYTSERQRRRVRSLEDVKDMVIGLATRDVLIARAKKLGLETDEEVKRQVKNATDDYLLRRWRKGVEDTVGQYGWDTQVLRNHFEANRSNHAIPPEVNVAEILVRTREEADEMLKQLKRGIRFADLARKNSIRLWAAKRDGELGFGTEATFGILGKKFLSARPGEIIGPEKVDPYYGVFRILERREGRAKTFEESVEQVKQELIGARRGEVFSEAVSALRSRASISVDNDLLANIVLE